jgi:hypothetical protein
VYPESALLEAELLLAVGDAEGAEGQFQSAFAAAGRIGLRMPQLRAATRLTRLQRDLGTRQDATMLRAIYDTFTEGFDSRDLVEARAMLEAAKTDGSTVTAGVKPL